MILEQLSGKAIAAIIVAFKKHGESVDGTSEFAKIEAYDITLDTNKGDYIVSFNPTRESLKGQNVRHSKFAASYVIRMSDMKILKMIGYR